MEIRFFKRDEVLRLLYEAEVCMEKWPSTPESIHIREMISGVILNMRDNIDSDVATRASVSTGAFRCITDSMDIEGSDAGLLVLEAITHYRGYSIPIFRKHE
jgi:hypothetical protein